MKNSPSGPRSARRRPKLYVIGLTGNIATGKSSVARMLACLGAHVIDADKVAHQVMRAGTPVHAAIVAEFGPDIVREDGEIDRGKLGAIVFADPQALARLETLVHPAVIAAVEQALDEIAASAGGEGAVAVVEAIKLIESGMAEAYDALWVVIAPEAAQKARLMQQRSLSAAEAERRIRAQPPASAKVALADVVIDNGGTLQETWQQVQGAWQALVCSLDKKGRFW